MADAVGRQRDRALHSDREHRHFGAPGRRSHNRNLRRPDRLANPGDVVTIPVSVVVGSNVFGQVNPIAFTMPEGGSALPQVLAVASTGTKFTFSSAVYTANGGNWLTISNLGGECCTTPDSDHGQRQRRHAAAGHL